MNRARRAIQSGLSTLNLCLQYDGKKKTEHKELNLLIASFLIPDTRYQIPDTRYQIPDTRYASQNFVSSYQLPKNKHANNLINTKTPLLLTLQLKSKKS